MLLIGVICFVGGAICVLGAMVFERREPSFWKVWSRGSFQRKVDYTPSGWRLYWFGSILGIVGFAIAFASELWF